MKLALTILGFAGFGLLYIGIGCACIVSIDRAKIAHAWYVLLVVVCWPIVVTLATAMALVRIAWWMACQR